MKCIALTHSVPCMTQRKDQTCINSGTSIEETAFSLQWALPALTFKR